jgi:hypothetical protein
MFLYAIARLAFSKPLREEFNHRRSQEQGRETINNIYLNFFIQKWSKKAPMTFFDRPMKLVGAAGVEC